MAHLLKYVDCYPLTHVGCSVCDWTGDIWDRHSAHDCAGRQIEIATEPLKRRVADLERNLRELAIGQKK